MLRLAARFAFVIAIGAASASPLMAVSFTTSYTDGGTWSTVFAQGFKASVSPSPDLGHPISQIVHLDRFEFFKSGATEYDTGGGVLAPIPPALKVQLAIVSDNYFLNLDDFTTDSPLLVGLSTNTIADVGTIATGDPIRFDFDGLELVYGEDSPEEIASNVYAAILVTNNDGALEAVRVPAITVDYLPEQNEIESDYGQQGNYFLSASNFMHSNEFGTYLDAFNATATNRYGDANFVAYFDLPEGLTGDFNDDGKVDAADYTVWRDNLGSLYDVQDYADWKANFGMMAGSGSLTTSAVPEPSSLAMNCVVAALGLVQVSRFRAR